MIDETGKSDIKTVPCLKDEYMTLAKSAPVYVLVQNESWVSIGAAGSPLNVRLTVEDAWGLRDLLTHAMEAHSERMATPATAD